MSSIFFYTFNVWYKQEQAVHIVWVYVWVGERDILFEIF